MHGQDLVQRVSEQFLYGRGWRPEDPVSRPARSGARQAKKPLTRHATNGLNRDLGSFPGDRSAGTHPGGAAVTKLKGPDAGRCIQLSKVLWTISSAC
jgi:hypothetical protein